jgi:hypothetical protein
MLDLKRRYNNWEKKYKLETRAVCKIIGMFEV